MAILVARIPNGRKPALPQTPEEAQRRRRLLTVAAKLVERDGYERVQMTEIAKTSGLAISTLYRYFPSKAKLFEIALYEEMAMFADEWASAFADNRPAELADQLIALTRRFAQRPRLASAMFHASTAGYPTTSVDERTFQEVPLQKQILATVGITEPTEVDRQRAQLLTYSWWSILVKIVVGDASREYGESQLRLACHLIFAESVSPDTGD